MNLLAALLLLQAPPSQGDLVRQARQALTQAEQAASYSGSVCRAGEWEKCNALLADTQQGVEQAKEALDRTGINPQRNPRHFKDAEIRTRKILKLLRALVSYIHPDDQRRYESVVGRVSEINDQLLSSIVVKKKESKRKKK